MTSSWTPKFDNTRGPLYWRIAAALVNDIRSGRLGAGERLPTHRALADALGVTANTVTKAYAEAERNGLVVSRTGRGTYVKMFPEEVAQGTTESEDVIDLSINNITSVQFNDVFNRLLGALSRRGSLYGLMDQHPHPGFERHRVAGARWLSRRGLDADANRVIVCNGAQNGLLASLAAVTRPRDTVLAEKLNYAGVRCLADILRLDLRGIEIDEEGMIPDELEAACRKDKVTAILVTPTNQNPTNAVMSLERRKAVVEIARKAGALLIEDDIFGHLSGDGAPTLAALAPDRCIYVCGLSKSIAAGLRVGYIVSPAALVNRIVDSLDTIHWSSPVLMGEIATLLIEDGEADEFLAWHRREARARYSMVRNLLGLENRAALPSYHMWVPLPDPWRPADFVAELKSRGVLVSPADKFAVDRSAVPHAIRISFGLLRDNEKLQRGVEIIADCFGGRPHRLHNIRQA